MPLWVEVVCSWIALGLSGIVFVIEGITFVQLRGYAKQVKAFERKFGCEKG